MEKKPPVKLILSIIAVVSALPIIIFNFPFGTVGAGERGVMLNFGAVSGEELGEGLYFRIPIYQKVVKMDVKVQKDEVVADAASKDLQTVNSTIALNYHLDPTRVAEIYQEVGKEYNARIIAPAIQESVKAITAKFTAEQLITERPIVRDEIKSLLREKVSDRGIVVDDFNIVNFDFSQSFNEAIEGKVTAEQDALAAKNKLEQVKFEAQQKIEEAKGKAEAIRIEAQALQTNPALIQLRAIEKWDGSVPTYWGDTPLPFVNVK